MRNLICLRMPADFLTTSCCASIAQYCVEDSTDPGCTCGGMVSQRCPFETLNCVECRDETAPQVLDATEDCLSNSTVTLQLNASVPYPLADTIVRCMFWESVAGGYVCTRDCSILATLVDAKTVRCPVPSPEYSQETATRIGVQVRHQDSAAPNLNSCYSTLGAVPSKAYHYAAIVACGPLSAPLQDQCPFADYSSATSPCTLPACRNFSSAFSGSSGCCAAARGFCDAGGNLNDRGCDCAAFAAQRCTVLPDSCAPQQAQAQCLSGAAAANILRLAFDQSYARYIVDDSSTNAALFRAVVTSSLTQRGVATSADITCINLEAGSTGGIQSQVIFTSPEVATKAQVSVEAAPLEFVFDGAAFSGSASDEPPAKKGSRGIEAIIAGAGAGLVLVVLLIAMLRNKRSKRTDGTDDGFQADSFGLDQVGSGTNLATLQMSYSLSSMDASPTAAIPEVPSMAQQGGHRSPLRAMTMATDEDVRQLQRTLGIQPIHLACLRNDVTALDALLRSESPRVSMQHLAVPTTPSSAGGYSPVPDIDAAGSGHTTMSSSQGLRVMEGMGSGHSTMAPGVGLLPLDAAVGCSGDELPCALLQDSQGRRAVHYAVRGSL